MVDLKTLRTQNLRKLVDETEQHLDELKAELDRREDQGRHQEIDKLEGHLKNAELSLQTIKDFLSDVLKELRTKTSA